MCVRIEKKWKKGGTVALGGTSEVKAAGKPLAFRLGGKGGKRRNPWSNQQVSVG